MNKKSIIQIYESPKESQKSFDLKFLFLIANNAIYRLGFSN